MSILTAKTTLLAIRPRIAFTSRLSSSIRKEESNEEEHEFRKLKIPGVHIKADRADGGKSVKKKASRGRQYIKRHQTMKPDQDWTNAWPTAASFKASAVPFPVRQGAVYKLNENEGVTPAKENNLELMKIPNFLHLTPPHIKKHCSALKDLCTKWPEQLHSNIYKEYFPVEAVSSDFCFSGSNIRDPRARTVTFKFKLWQLNLDAHGRHKFIRLVGDRYNKLNDEVTLTSDRCPLKKQNEDYLEYLLTVLYLESMTVEDWELEEERDDKKVEWDSSTSRQNVLELLKIMKNSPHSGMEPDQNDVSAEKIKDKRGQLEKEQENLHTLKTEFKRLTGKTWNESNKLPCLNDAYYDIVSCLIVKDYVKGIGERPKNRQKSEFGDVSDKERQLSYSTDLSDKNIVVQVEALKIDMLKAGNVFHQLKDEYRSTTGDSWKPTSVPPSNCTDLHEKLLAQSEMYSDLEEKLRHIIYSHSKPKKILTNKRFKLIKELSSLKKKYKSSTGEQYQLSDTGPPSNSEDIYYKILSSELLFNVLKKMSKIRSVEMKEETHSSDDIKLQEEKQEMEEATHSSDDIKLQEEKQEMEEETHSSDDIKLQEEKQEMEDETHSSDDIKLQEEKQEMEDETHSSDDIKLQEEKQSEMIAAVKELCKLKDEYRLTSGKHWEADSVPSPECSELHQKIQSQSNLYTDLQSEFMEKVQTSGNLVAAIENAMKELNANLSKMQAAYESKTGMIIESTAPLSDLEVVCYRISSSGTLIAKLEEEIQDIRRALRRKREKKDGDESLDDNVAIELLKDKQDEIIDAFKEFHKLKDDYRFSTGTEWNYDDAPSSELSDLHQKLLAQSKVCKELTFHMSDIIDRCGDLNTFKAEIEIMNKNIDSMKADYKSLTGEDWAYRDTAPSSDSQDSYYNILSHQSVVSNLKNLINDMEQTILMDDILPKVKRYRRSLLSLVNGAETKEAVNLYKQAVLDLYDIPKLESCEV